MQNKLANYWTLLVRSTSFCLYSPNYVTFILGMPLDNVQDESLATIVNAIDNNQDASSTLEQIFSEAESSKEGRGGIL